MPGTLLVFDDAFPRPRDPSPPIRNTPGTDELRANSYPEPFRLLPVAEASPPDAYFAAIAGAARDMARLDRLIIFGHGRERVVGGAGGATRVTTGIVIGAADITASNASGLRPARRHLARNALAELWVCSAASASEAGGMSGTLLCQAIADALGAVVVAARITQQYSTADQRWIEGSGWQSTVQFLPWEGETVRFRPRR